MAELTPHRVTWHDWLFRRSMMSTAKRITVERFSEHDSGVARWRRRLSLHMNSLSPRVGTWVGLDLDGKVGAVMSCTPRFAIRDVVLFAKIAAAFTVVVVVVLALTLGLVSIALLLLFVPMLFVCGFILAGAMTHSATRVAARRLGVSADGVMAHGLASATPGDGRAFAFSARVLREVDCFPVWLQVDNELPALISRYSREWRAEQIAQGPKKTTMIVHSPPPPDAG